MEMAVRLSFGATRRQLLMQLLTESLVLAALGGAVSLIVARWTLGFIGTMLPPEVGPVIALELQLPTALFAAALAIGTGILFGLFPALHSTRPDLVTTMRANTGQLSGARSATRFRTSLVTAQIALSMMLLVSAGLFIKSLRNVSRVDLGLKVDNVITFGISPTLNGYPNVRTRALLQRVEEELSVIPGVTSASASMVTLLVGDNWANSVSVQGWKNPPDGDNGSQFNGVGPAFFRTLSIPVLSGREFLPSDIVGAPRVVIVNEAFTKKFGLGRDAVGKLMATGGRQEQLDMTIVGVVHNAKYSDVKDEIPPTYYVPYRQDTTVGSASFYVRTSLEPTQVLRMIPALMARLDPDLPVENLKTVPQVVRENVFFDRMISILSSAFAALATLLAAVGLYGVLAYTVARRTREIGVRMALGADASRVRGMVLRQVCLMTLIGGAIGIAGALALGQAASSLLYRLNGYDPLVLVIAVVSLTVVALGAGYLPALRASRVDPMQALRYE
jgi:predicted permease